MLGDVTVDEVVEILVILKPRVLPERPLTDETAGNSLADRACWGGPNDGEGDLENGDGILDGFALSLTSDFSEGGDP